MIGKFTLASTLVLGIAGLGAGVAGADPLPLGSEFQLNSATSGDQRGPRLAASSSGAFVAVWQGPETGGSLGIRAQRYSSSGVATGSEFAVNGTTTGDQTRPAAAMLANGDFVVAWQGPDASGTGIFARRFLANGTAVASEFAVNATTTGAQEAPAVAYLEDGQILVAWRSDGQDGSSGGIYARTIAANGTASSELLVNTTTTGDQADPAVAAAEQPSALYYVAWEGPDASGTGIFLQRVSTSAALVGSQIAVNTTTAGAQENPALAASAYLDEEGGDGLSKDPGPNRIVVAWQGPDSGSSPAGRGRIWYQLYDSTATAHGGNQLVDDDPTAPDQSDPDVAMGDALTDGFLTFTAVWTETADTVLTGSGLTGSSIAILAANRPRSSYFNGGGFAGSGETPNSEILVSLPGTAAGLPAIAAAPSGNFACLWQAYGLDGSGDGVFGRRYLGEGAPVPVLYKTVEGSVAPGDTVVYTLTLVNYGPNSILDNDNDEIKDELPGSLVLLDAKANEGDAAADFRTNTVRWNGELGPGETMVLTIWARIELGASGQVVNQAVLSYDADLDNDNESHLPSDDPAVAGNENPTVFVVDDKLFSDGFEKGTTDDWSVLSFQP